VTALHRKLLRDLWHVRGQAIAIAMVLGCGVAMFVMSLSTLTSLQRTRNAYYQQYRFADVFAQLKRAPDTLASRLAAIPGVARVQTRVVVDVTLDVAGLSEPAVGRLISLPDRQQPGLNGVFLRRGRQIDPLRSGEVLVGEAFAQVHGLRPGDQITAVINGRYQPLTIVGVALSPEYVLQIQPGSLLPDEKRFGVFWMSRTQLAMAQDMDGAFNDVSLAVMRGASEAEVIRRVDALLEPYGGGGAYGRDEQTSHRYLSDEITQLRSMGTVAPAIFLSVAAFLLNVVMARQVRTQREQIAALKAFGYSRREIGSHYLQFVLLIAAVGCLAGVGVGAWMGHGMTELYTRFYKFPIFRYHLEAPLILAAAAISVLAASLGALSAVRAAVILPPAEAMRPEPPARYRPTLIEQTGLGVLLSPAGRMIVRNLQRHPLKAVFSGLGIAMSVAVLILGSFMEDALNYLIRFQFALSQRLDVTVVFVEPVTSGLGREIEQLPGVLRVEPFRTVATRLRWQHHSRRVAIMGLPAGGRLFRLLNDQEQPVRIPIEGLLLSTKLAELLQVGLNDAVTVELLEGDRSVHRVRVTGLVTEFGGLNAYMNKDALHRLLGEEKQASGVHLQVQRDRSGGMGERGDSREPADVTAARPTPVADAQQRSLYRQLKHTPKVASVNVKDAVLQSFRDTIGENLNMMRSFNVIFASIIAIGVVYNSARIALAERSWELATLRVIGFTRGEISVILLGELAIVTLAALPVGMLIGYVTAAGLCLGLDTESYRIPLVIARRTYAFACLVVLIASIASGLTVVRDLRRLDLVAVLKTKE
jgi:putative ABC transport system permease protein